MALRRRVRSLPRPWPLPVPSTLYLSRILRNLWDRLTHGVKCLLTTVIYTVNQESVTPPCIEANKVIPKMHFL